ncbi:hypothetical protein FSP39_003915 [Pinctada imbricata]|uniref:RRP12-like protein n=1 Tax=Pinctada imbricata TaxID=66713 RepID=A0AA88Y5C2_PINIB|nr:hypothetical protein FSP39_003915 [Pinctada imbricata]
MAAVKKQKLQGTRHKKVKGKRWKKGQSSSSNPETKKFREAAKNRFFNPNPSGSSLTVDALAKHDEKQVDRDGDTIVSDKDVDIRSAAGKTFNTWATNWTECTNATFSKVHRYWACNSALHKEILAILAAVTEVIKTQGGTESETEYFAALMTALETSDSTESISAIVYLLSLVIKRVSPAVLRSRFSEISRQFLDKLAVHADNDNTSLLKSLLKCLASVLRVQDQATWSNSSTQRIYDSLLTFSTHKKPKVRKAGHQAVCLVIKGSLFMLGDNAPNCHPAAQQTAKFCIKKIEQCGGTGEAVDTLHILALLKDVLSSLPLNSVKSVCETILRMMTLSNVMVTACGMQALYGLLSSKPKPTTLSAELNAQIITALYDYQPSENDVQPMQAWLAVMEKAHSNLARLDEKLCLSHLPRIFSSCMTCLLSEKTEIVTSAAKCMKALLKECVEVSVESIKVQITQSSSTQTAVHKVIKALETGLSYQFYAAWGWVMQMFALLYEVLGKHCPQLFKKSLLSIADLRDSPKFPYKAELDHAFGCAIKHIGPRHVLEAVPLNITGDDDDYNFPRSWILPVIRDNVTNTELGFFVSYFLPLAAKFRQRVVEAQQCSNVVLAKSYESLQLQVWSFLPGFCTNPVDLKQSFKSIAKVLGTAISDRPDLRMEVMSSLRKLITKSLQDDESKKEVGRFAKNFLPILFNLFTTDSDNNSVRLAVLETIKCYVQIADKPIVCSFCDKCLEKLKEEGITAFKQHALLDLLMVKLPYVDKGRLKLIHQVAVPNLTASDRTVQKKSYRILEEMCGQTSPDCRMYITENLLSIQNTLLESLSSSSPSSKAPRLRCLNNLFKGLDEPQTDFLHAVIPEAILCTKEVAERARTAAFSLLVEMGRAQVRWSTTTSQEALHSYFKLVMAGLAGSPQMISATLLALTRILYEFKDEIDSGLLDVIVDTLCLLLTSKPREVVKAALGFMKVLLSAYPDTRLACYLKQLVSSLVSMKEDCHHHFRSRAKEIYAKLIKKFGYQTIYSMAPASVHKVLINIKKTQERAKRKKKEKENEEESEEEGEHFKTQTESIDDILRDTDSEMEEDEVQKKKGKGKGKMQREKEGRSDQAWLHEGEGDIMDFLDPDATKKVIATKPNEQKRNASKSKEPEFKTAPDGRLIITEDSDDEGDKKNLSDEDDLDELLEAIEKGSGATKRAKKRKVEDMGSDNEEASAPKYKAGGRGIHRPLAKAQKSTTTAEKSDYGAEYRAKKAKGDIKKKGKPDPFAYVPLNYQALNRRKKAKVKGRFNNLVRGAQKGAMKGSKGKKRKS